MIPGVYAIPLSYIIREQEEPAHNVEFNDDFMAEMVVCGQLHGPKFCTDVCKVHQLLKNFQVAESAEQWIHPGHANNQHVTTRI